MKSFVPLYQGKPGNMDGFFRRGSDENLIVLPLAGSGSLEIIFHEYSHLLMRHNDAFWPIWLKEGMAEVYGTFEVTGPRGVRIGKPLARHLRRLAREPMLPLKQLLEVTHDSPEYNEQEHQGIFYAQSWLLTHYLMLGARKAEFGQFTALLRQGQSSAQAFTNAFSTPLSAMDKELKGYLSRGRFEPLALSVNRDLTAPQGMVTRSLMPVEVWFRLGDQLLRVERYENAETCFRQALKLAPGSPLPYEGLGLLAVECDESAEALRWLNEARRRGSVSFRAHYQYAREQFEAHAASPGRHSRLKEETASDIRTALRKSLALMPNFGPAHHLLGLFEFIQGEDLPRAVRHLKKAIQLEPENQAYVLSRAQAQYQMEGPATALRTLEPLRLPYVESQVRAHAEELIKRMAK